MRTVRLVLVGDPATRDAVRAELDGDLRVVGEAADADGAVDRVAADLPDVVLLGARLAGGSGGRAEVVRRCAGLLSATGRPVVVLALGAPDGVLGGHGRASMPDGHGLSEAVRRAAGRRTV